MAEEKDDAERSKRTRINLNETYQVAYWTKALGISEAELRKTVDKVGPLVADVRRALGRQTLPRGAGT